MKVAVVGHVEWIEFLRVEAVPRPGEIVGVQETWEEPAGGGGVAAVELARLAGEASLFCLLGGDERGAQARVRLEAAGVRVHSPSIGRAAAARVRLPGRGRRADDHVIGEKPRPKGGEGTLPWEQLDETDGVYFTAGDAEAVRQARRARVLVATARELPTLHAAGVELDALVASGEDESERYQPGDLEPPPKLVVSTAGSLGGWAQPGGPYKAAAPPGPYEDVYGAGDCFAAGPHLRTGQGDGRDRGARLRLGAGRARADAQGRRPHGLSATRRTSGAAASRNRASLLPSAAIDASSRFGKPGRG